MDESKSATMARPAVGRRAEHKIAHPSEQSVRIRDALDVRALHDDLERLLDRHRDLLAVNIACGAQRDVEVCLSGLKSHPVLLQKLSALRDELPEIYDGSLLVAWLATVLVRRMGRPAAEMHMAFLAGIAHDLGLLHVPVAGRRIALEPSAREWRALQSHVLVGKLLVQSLPGVNQRAARAVLEHHERADGSGYLSGRAGGSLDPLGQVVGLCDTAIAIRRDQFGNTGRTLGDLRPYLQMNAHRHPREIAGALLGVMEAARLGIGRSRRAEGSPLQAARLSARGRVLQNVAGLLDRTLRLAAELRLPGLGLHAEGVRQMVATSGLLSAELMTWLGSVGETDDRAELDDLNVIDLMQNEIVWQVRSLRRRLVIEADEQAARLPEANAGLLVAADEAAVALAALAF